MPNKVEYDFKNEHLHVSDYVPIIGILKQPCEEEWQTLLLGEMGMRLEAIFQRGLIRNFFILTL